MPLWQAPLNPRGNTPNGRRLRGTGAFDPLTDALLSRMSVEPSAARKNLINDRIVSGKSKSFWAKLDALWLHAAHDAQAARLNWLSASYDCQPVNNPTFTTDRGYLGDGSSSYLDTQFNPTTAPSPKYSLDSGSLGVRSNTDNFAAGSLAGFYAGAENWGSTINPRVDNTNNRAVFRINQGGTALNATVGTSPTSIGLYVANRLGSADIRGYRDGVKVATGTIASAAMANGTIRLGSINASSFRACQMSMSFLGAGLSDQEVQDIFDWFEPYRTAVGVT